jgi:hypothetical protein
MRAPSPADIRTMLSDICTNSSADVSFDKLTFSINGSDDAVKAAMMVIYQIPFVKRTPYQMRVKIELANEHKEFVSGKKNGKINKIMGQSMWPAMIPFITANFLKATSRLSLMASTSTISTLMSVGTSMMQLGTVSILLNKRCLLQSPFMCQTSIINALLGLEDSTFNES